MASEIALAVLPGSETNLLIGAAVLIAAIALGIDVVLHHVHAFANVLLLFVRHVKAESHAIAEIVRQIANEIRHW